MSENAVRKRGQAYEGKGYGTMRKELFEKARSHIEKSLSAGYYCEAIAIIESVITDRLESRLSFLQDKNVGFQTLGRLVAPLLRLENDEEMKKILHRVKDWSELRNRAIHEMVKVEADKVNLSWDDRIACIGQSARTGYEIAKDLYNKVADLNPRHLDRVFPRT